MKNKKIIILIIAVFMFLCWSSMIYAWYEVSKEGSLVLESPEFNKISYDITFKDDNSLNAFFDTNGLLVVKGHKKTENETIATDEFNNVNGYLENLNVNVEFTPNVTCYLRIKITDAWLRIRTYATGEQLKEYFYYEEFSKFTFADGWYYDEATGYIYYENLIVKSEIEVTIPFISNISANCIDIPTGLRYTDEYKVTIDFISELVQANRFEEIWGIDSIPQEGAGN